jgi:hypothetical protein
VRPGGRGEVWRRAERKDIIETRRSRLRLADEALRWVIAGKNATVGLPYGLVTRGYPGAKHVRAFDSGSPSKKGETTPELVKPADTMVETMASIDASPYITEPAS